MELVEESVRTNESSLTSLGEWLPSMGDYHLGEKRSLVQKACIQFEVPN